MRLHNGFALACSALITVASAMVACASPTGDGDDTASSDSESTGTGSDGGSGSDTGTGSDTGSDSSTDTDTDTDTGEPGSLLLSDQFLVIAHRGGGRLRPEATLVAFENALAVGADVIEMDLHATADGVIVVIHDDTVDRTTDGTGAVADMSFDELRMLDAGYDFSPDGGQSFPYRGMGIVVPTMIEVLESFPDAYYLMEIKQSDPPIVDEVLGILADHQVGDRIVIASFDDPTIEAVRAGDPTLFTAMSAAEMGEFLAQIDDPGYRPPCLFLQSPWDITSAAVIERAHSLGMKVHPWTVNEAGLMTDLIDRGVDGIMTDDPALLAEVAGAP